MLAAYTKQDPIAADQGEQHVMRHLTNDLANPREENSSLTLGSH